MAASGAGVTVLAPNGRRQVVKVTAGTPLLQVLEEVCKKQNFNPREYNLKFQRTVLDLSLQWRFANLPNNAKLEMVSCSMQRAGAECSKVRVALQLEDGTRLQDEYQCSKTLWDVLVSFPQTKVCLDEVPPGSVAVCIYMRDEVSGESLLKQTSLLSLGLTGGSAIIRFVVRKNDPSGSRQPSSTEEDTKRERGSGLKEGSKVLPTSEDVKKKPAPCQEERLSIKASGREEPQEVASAKAAASSVEKVQSSVDSVKPKAPTQSRVTSFVPFQGGGYRLGGANIPAASFEDDLQCATAQEPLHSPEHSKPKKSKTDIEDSESESLDREPIVCYLDLERNVRANKMDLPDDFFEVTVDDVRRRFAELKRERHRLEETPLMTKALREAQLKEKLDRYPKVVLRVLFPDRFILQGFFQVTDTIGAVREFVESHLQEPGIPFYLFITPPRTELMDDSETLFQARLFPAAFVHFGSVEQRDHYLQLHLLTAPMSPSQADMVVARAMPRVSGSYTAPVMEDLPGPSSQVSRRAPENYEEELGISDSNQQVQRDASKVPKWLKLSGKK
ncbi:PREDICTED: tether containing UBX domain for GLUT4 [Nanorana parkeri]|uniref:tether containing UBX domain for GLUT4 n=1 Tax=Nanorana parkeri TaxID=125878 RepID=UPI000854CD36|nr:PREDICTED: tether containing UBX domain for GLUT4 [Nanorana parkeri]